MLDLTIFGYTTAEDERRVRHSAVLAFDTHRNLLTNVMKVFDHVERSMRAIDEKTDKIKHVHDAFRRQAATIPHLWEENENLLRTLVVPSRLCITYGLVAAKESPDAPRTDTHDHCDSTNTAELDFPVLPPTANMLWPSSEPEQLSTDLTVSEQILIRERLYHDGASPSSPSRVDTSFNDSAPVSYDSLEQVLVHLARDWSKKGEDVRQRLYFDGVIPTLARFLPAPSVINNEKLRILVPGAGMGRLAIELAARGYLVEANECSGVMVCAIKTLLTDVLPNLQFNWTIGETETEGKTNLANPMLFYPLLSPKLVDSWDLAGRLHPVTVPSEDSLLISDWTKTLLSNNNNQLTYFSPHFVVQMGPFEQVYSAENHQDKFDSVVTCFFIDTAVKLHQYLAVIAHVLKEGGVWLNVGPLHYHDRKSIPYSYVEMLQIVTSCGFEVLSQEILPAFSYVGEDDLSMQPNYYRVPLDVFKLVRKADAWPLELDQGKSMQEENRTTTEKLWERTDFQLL